MTRKRLLQGLFSVLFILFLLVILFKFRPRVGITPSSPASDTAARKTPDGELAAKGFHYTQQSGGRIEYEVTAERISDQEDGRKHLVAPIIVIPGQGKAWGKQGNFNPQTHEMRIWEDAHAKSLQGWVIDSTGFIFTKEGELRSESAVTFHKDDMKGSADLFRYNRNSEKASLEGNVKVSGKSGALVCASLFVDLKTHDGRMDGPVSVSRDKNTVKAPAGTIKLDANNKLKSVTLGTPSNGSSPNVKYRSESTTVRFLTDGSMRKIILKGKVEADSTGNVARHIESDRLELKPAVDRWAWLSPSKLVMSGKSEEATAASGSGKIGGKLPMEANLAGPVNGKDSRGSFSSRRAYLRKGTWTLEGDAKAESTDSLVLAKRIRSLNNGSYRASGDVRGRKVMKDGTVLTFKSEKAYSGKGGYPVNLKGNVKVEKEAMILSAPSVLLESEKMIRATGGAFVVFEDKKRGSSEVHGESITYDGASGTAKAVGKASGRGRSYNIDADSLTAVLDRENHPVSYESEGRCSFDGKDYRGKGDRLSYNPTEEKGRAESDKSLASVYDKRAGRELTGRVIIFGRDSITVPGSARGLVRGKLEGSRDSGKKVTKGGTGGRQKK